MYYIPYLKVFLGIIEHLGFYTRSLIGVKNAVHSSSSKLLSSPHVLKNAEAALQFITSRSSFDNIGTSSLDCHFTLVIKNYLYTGPWSFLIMLVNYSQVSIDWIFLIHLIAIQVFLLIRITLQAILMCFMQKRYFILIFYTSWQTMIKAHCLSRYTLPITGNE